MSRGESKLYYAPGSWSKSTARSSTDYSIRLESESDSDESQDSEEVLFLKNRNPNRLRDPDDVIVNNDVAVTANSESGPQIESQQSQSDSAINESFRKVDHNMWRIQNLLDNLITDITRAKPLQAVLTVYDNRLADRQQKEVLQQQQLQQTQYSYSVSNYCQYSYRIDVILAISGSCICSFSSENDNINFETMTLAQFYGEIKRKCSASSSSSLAAADIITMMDMDIVDLDTIVLENMNRILANSNQQQYELKHMRRNYSIKLLQDVYVIDTKQLLQQIRPSRQLKPLVTKSIVLKPLHYHQTLQQWQVIPDMIKNLHQESLMDAFHETDRSVRILKMKTFSLEKSKSKNSKSKKNVKLDLQSYSEHGFDFSYNPNSDFYRHHYHVQSESNSESDANLSQSDNESDSNKIDGESESYIDEYNKKYNNLYNEYDSRKRHGHFLLRQYIDLLIKRVISGFEFFLSNYESESSGESFENNSIGVITLDHKHLRNSVLRMENVASGTRPKSIFELEPLLEHIGQFYQQVRLLDNSQQQSESEFESKQVNNKLSKKYQQSKLLKKRISQLSDFNSKQLFNQCQIQQRGQLFQQQQTGPMATGKFHNSDDNDDIDMIQQEVCSNHGEYQTSESESNQYQSQGPELQTEIVDIVTVSDNLSESDAVFDGMTTPFDSRGIPIHEDIHSDSLDYDAAYDISESDLLEPYIGVYSWIKHLFLTLRQIFYATQFMDPRGVFTSDSDSESFEEWIFRIDYLYYVLNNKVEREREYDESVKNNLESYGQSHITIEDSMNRLRVDDRRLDKIVETLKTWV